MQLIINGQRTYQLDELSVLTRHLNRLPVNQFAILSGEDPDSYVQTYRNGDEDFQLEYQEGSLDNHFIADGGSSPLSNVIAAFEAFFTAGDINGVTHWERMEL